MLRRGDFLPDIVLPSAGGRAPVPLRPAPGRTAVLLVLDRDTCPACQHYLDELASLGEEFSVWDACLLVAVPHSATYMVPAFGTLIRDPERLLAVTEIPAVFVADRYGQLWDVVCAGPAHRFPPARDIAEWLKYLGTLCPE